MNVVFLANSFHLTKTKSVDFLIELLREWYGQVTVVPHKEAWARLPGTKWDLLVAFQHLYSPQELEAFGARATVLVPMYDDSPTTKEFWQAYQGIKILSFSRTLGEDLKSWGLEALSVQYYHKVGDRAPSGRQGLRGFFWPRTRGLNWSHIRPLLGTTPWESFHLHVTNPEGAEVLPTEKETSDWKIRRTEWFESPADFQKVLAEASVVFAPRRYEGIGQAVLEALALGQCVVAPNFPTMNEYITDGVDGYLYDPDQPAPLDFSRVGELAEAARNRAIRGREAWERSLPAIRAFVETETPRTQRRFHPWIAARGRGTAVLRSVFQWLKRVLNRG